MIKLLISTAELPTAAECVCLLLRSCVGICSVERNVDARTSRDYHSTLGGFFVILNSTINNAQQCYLEICNDHQFRCNTVIDWSF